MATLPSNCATQTTPCASYTNRDTIAGLHVLRRRPQATLEQSACGLCKANVRKGGGLQASSAAGHRSSNCLRRRHGRASSGERWAPWLPPSPCLTPFHSSRCAHLLPFLASTLPDLSLHLNLIHQLHHRPVTGPSEAEPAVICPMRGHQTHEGPCTYVQTTSRRLCGGYVSPGIL